MFSKTQKSIFKSKVKVYLPTMKIIHLNNIVFKHCNLFVYDLNDGYCNECTNKTCKYSSVLVTSELHCSPVTLFLH